MDTASVAPEPFAPQTWAASCDSVPELRDATHKLAAIDEYLARTSTEGRNRVAEAMRQLEARIGELMGAAQVGAHSSASEGAGLTPNERYAFRQMAAHRDVMEQVIAESSDESPPSRRKVLGAFLHSERGRATTLAQLRRFPRVSPGQWAASKRTRP